MPLPRNGPGSYWGTGAAKTGVERSLSEWAVYVKCAAWTVRDGNRDSRRSEIGCSTLVRDGLTVLKSL